MKFNSTLLEAQRLYYSQFRDAQKAAPKKEAEPVVETTVEEKLETVSETVEEGEPAAVIVPVEESPVAGIALGSEEGTEDVLVIGKGKKKKK